VEVHRAGVQALEALANSDMAGVLRHLDSMESASMRVLENLQRMGQAAISDPSALCTASDEHSHDHHHH